MDHACYLVVANNIQALSDHFFTAREVYDTLMDLGFWDFADRAPFFRKFKPGDKLVFYLAGSKSGRQFVGEAIVADYAKLKGKNDVDPFAPANVPYYPWRVPLTDIKRWKNGKPLTDFLNVLSFLDLQVTPRQQIGLKFRGGIRLLSEPDYLKLTEV